MSKKFNSIINILIILLIIILVAVMMNYYLDTSVSEIPTDIDTMNNDIVLNNSGNSDKIITNNENEKNTSNDTLINIASKEDKSSGDTENNQLPEASNGDEKINEVSETSSGDIGITMLPEQIDEKKNEEVTSPVIMTSENDISSSEKREILSELDKTLMELLEVVDKVQPVDESRLIIDDGEVQE